MEAIVAPGHGAVADCLALPPLRKSFVQPDQDVDETRR